MNSESSCSHVALFEAIPACSPTSSTSTLAVNTLLECKVLGDDGALTGFLNALRGCGRVMMCSALASHLSRKAGLRCLDSFWRHGGLYRHTTSERGVKIAMIHVSTLNKAPYKR